MTRSIVVSLVVLSAAATARAQGVDPAARASAEQKFRAGEQAYNAGKYADAALAFEDAWKVLPLPAIAFSAAQAYRLQYFTDKKPGYLKRAIELYRVYLDKVPEGGRRTDASTSLAELEPLLARIEEQSGKVKAEVMQVSTTQLMISTSIEGAQVSIDGAAPSAAPVVREVEPGEHAIAVSADGYFPVEQKKTAVKGELVVFEIELKEKPALVKLRTDAGAEVTVDGRPAGATPLSRPLELSAGKHFVAVIKRGRHAWSREIEVARGEELELQASLEKTTQRTVSYWVMGASAATIAAAGVYGYLAWSDDSDASDLLARIDAGNTTSADLVRYRELVQSRDDNRDTMFTLLAAGGALATTGVLLYLIDTPRAELPPASAPAVSAVAGDGFAGIAVSGAF
jgi:tetratricopeptide (TPR) repeat protein